MGILDGFEKLINEHGSAAILKERIDLARDQHAALEQKLAASEAANKQLHSEKLNLELNNVKLKGEAKNLKEQLVKIPSTQN